MGFAVLVHLGAYGEAAAILIAFIAVQGIGEAFGYGASSYTVPTFTPIESAPTVGDPEMEG